MNQVDDLEDFWFSFSHPIHNVDDSRLYDDDDMFKTQKKEGGLNIKQRKNRSNSSQSTILKCQDVVHENRDWNKIKINFKLYRKYQKSLLSCDNYDRYREKTFI